MTLLGGISLNVQTQLTAIEIVPVSVAQKTDGTA